MPLVETALRGKFVIPDFADFTAKIDEIYQECKSIEDGMVSSFCILLKKDWNQ